MAKLIFQQALGHSIGTVPNFCYVVLEVLEQMESGPECERLIKKVVGGMGSGLVGLHIKGNSGDFHLLSLGISYPGRGSLSSVSKAPDVKASAHRQ